MSWIVHHGASFVNDFWDLRQILFANLPHQNGIKTVVVVFFFLPSSAFDAECAEVVCCRGAIIPATQYEIGLAQRGLSGFPIRSSWRWCRQQLLLFWLSEMDKHSFTAGNYPSSNINKWGFFLFGVFTFSKPATPTQQGAKKKKLN